MMRLMMEIFLAVCAPDAQICELFGADSSDEGESFVHDQLLQVTLHACGRG